MGAQLSWSHSISGIIWVYDSTFATVNSMKSKYRLNISSENTSSELKCAVSVKYPPDFKNVIYIKHTKNINYLSNNFYIKYLL